MRQRRCQRRMNTSTWIQFDTLNFQDLHPNSKTGNTLHLYTQNTSSCSLHGARITTAVLLNTNKAVQSHYYNLPCLTYTIIILLRIQSPPICLDFACGITSYFTTHILFS